jgi:hypothetical protein
MILFTIKLALIVVIVCTLCFVGVPFDILPVGSRPVKIANRIWLNYNVNLPRDSSYSWQLSLNFHEDNVRPWDELASGSRMATGISQYEAVKPWLVIVRYAQPDGQARWKLLDVSKSFLDYKEMDFDSEASLRDELRNYGMTDNIQWKSTPQLWRLSVGALSSLIIIGALIAALGLLYSLRSGKGEGPER